MPRNRKVVMSVETFKNTDTTALGKLSKSDMSKLLSSLRRNMDRRMETIYNAGEMSWAYERLNEKMEQVNEAYIRKQKANGENPTGIPRDLRKMTRNQMYQELALLHEFFNAKTSTLKGIEQVSNEQDRRLFGDEMKQIKRGPHKGEWVSTGKPLYSMTTNERREFWKISDLFKSTMGVEYTRSIYGSDTMHSEVAVVFNENLDKIRALIATEGGLKDGVLIEFFNEVKNRLDAKDLDIDYEPWSRSDLIFDLQGNLNL